MAPAVPALVHLLVTKIRLRIQHSISLVLSTLRHGQADHYTAWLGAGLGFLLGTRKGVYPLKKNACQNGG